FGAPADQPVVLIAGSGACMYSWPDEFCALLAGRGRFVVRYDHRDTGRSTAYPVGTVGYGLRDLAGDVFRLLDAHGLARAHLVGASMGGMVAQVAALREPARVASLTLLSTSPAPPGADCPELPPPSLRVRQELADVDWPDWSDRDGVVAYLVALARVRSGPRGLDESNAIGIAGRTFDHASEPAAMTNHALLDYGPPWRERLAESSVPALVVHGSHDP